MDPVLSRHQQQQGLGASSAAAKSSLLFTWLSHQPPYNTHNRSSPTTIMALFKHTILAAALFLATCLLSPAGAAASMVQTTACRWNNASSICDISPGKHAACMWMACCIFAWGSAAVAVATFESTHIHSPHNPPMHATPPTPGFVLGTFASAVDPDNAFTQMLLKTYAVEILCNQYTNETCTQHAECAFDEAAVSWRILVAWRLAWGLVLLHGGYAWWRQFPCNTPNTPPTQPTTHST